MTEKTLWFWRIAGLSSQILPLLGGIPAINGLRVINRVGLSAGKTIDSLLILLKLIAPNLYTL